MGERNPEQTFVFAATRGVNNTLHQALTLWLSVALLVAGITATKAATDSQRIKRLEGVWRLADHCVVVALWCPHWHQNTALL